MKKLGDEMGALIARLKAKSEEETPEYIKEAMERSRLSKFRSRLFTCGIPSELSGFVLDHVKTSGETWRETEALSLLANAAQDPVNRILVLAGPTRTGKSVAAAWWLAHQEEGSQFWVSAPALAKMAPWSEEAKRAELADRLVLDDLGLDNETSRAQNAIESLLYERHAREELRTVITTNLKPDQFRSRYNDRLTNRLAEAGEYLICKTKEARRRK